MGSKSERKRAHILQTALELFEEKGYGQTTMRAIAKQAGVAQGAAYYYFRSKQELLLEFFSQRGVGSADRAATICAETPLLHERFLRLTRWKLARVVPHRRLFRVLYPRLIAPGSELSPFGAATAAIREREVGAFEILTHDTIPTLNPELQPHLPRLLWMAWMGIVLYWHHDTSPEQARTDKLLERGSQLLAGLLMIAGSAVLGPILEFLQALEGE